jgi:hypothetical protein
MILVEKILFTNDEYSLDKKTGNSYIFNVNLEHEITPILNGERYSLIWFLQYNNIENVTTKLI